jgi:hypothetical protein
MLWSKGSFDGRIITKNGCVQQFVSVRQTFVRMGIKVCCALHNFREDRGGGVPEEFDPDMAEDLVDRMPEDIEDVDVCLGGGAVRDILVDWCKAHQSLNDQPSKLQMQSLHVFDKSMSMSHMQHWTTLPSLTTLLTPRVHHPLTREGEER